MLHGKITWNDSDLDYKKYYQKITDRLAILQPEVDMLQRHKRNIEITKLNEIQQRNDDGSMKVNENGTPKFEWVSPLNQIREPMDEKYRLSLKTALMEKMDEELSKDEDIDETTPNEPPES